MSKLPDTAIAVLSAMAFGYLGIGFGIERNYDAAFMAVTTLLFMLAYQRGQQQFEEVCEIARKAIALLDKATREKAA